MMGAEWMGSVKFLIIILLVGFTGLVAAQSGKLKCLEQELLEKC